VPLSFRLLLSPLLGILPTACRRKIQRCEYNRPKDRLPHLSKFFPTISEWICFKIPGLCGFSYRSRLPSQRFLTVIRMRSHSGYGH